MQNIVQLAIIFQIYTHMLVIKGYNLKSLMMICFHMKTIKELTEQGIMKQDPILSIKLDSHQ